MSHETSSITEPENFLPELIPAEHFSHPFFAKVAAAYWYETNNPDRAYLSQQVLPVALTLNSQGLLELAKLIDDKFPNVKSRWGNYTETIWENEPISLSVDEDGDVYGKVGNVIEVVHFIKKYFNNNEDQYDYLEETLMDSVQEAAEKYRGGEYADIVDTALKLEAARRSMLPRPESPNQDQLDIPYNEE
jgi:hypothetical protein